MKCKMFSILRVLVVALALIILSGWNETPNAKAATWTKIWNDEFDGPAPANAGVNTANWLFDTGTSYPGGAANWGTGEVETMTNSKANVYQDGATPYGHLIIKPILSGGSWTSGRIETRSLFTPPAGGQLAVEASIQLPAGSVQGYWPAFWMLGAGFRGVYTNWPSIGEQDAMENANGTNTIYGTLHCGVSPGGSCNEMTGLQGSTHCSPDCQGALHTYRVEIDRSTSPEQIRWYLDGVQYWQVFSNNAGMDATTWANAVDRGVFIIFNVAIGGSFPGSPTASTASGVPMVVDYVRVYTSNN
jgi:beta-glucanase (GH16 family)